MKVLLINPWNKDVFPPPSIGYLQATLKKEGINVTAKNLNEALVDKNDYDIVGVSFHSFSVQYATRIREHFKGHLVCGGHHPSALPDQMLSIGYDQVVVGEGEQAIKEIVKGNKDKIVLCGRSNIDEIPFPDYSGLTFDNVMGVPIISSRGCPFNCSFCASAKFWNGWRMRSADNVLKEIYQLPGKVFMFEDDNFTANRKRVSDICKGLSGYTWQCASRAESLDEELCRELKQAECHTVWCGIESLSQDSLDRNNKKTTVEKMLKGIEIADKVGLQVMAQFIIGLPGDSEKDIILTVENIKRSKIKRKGVQILWILPGTKAYYLAKEKGFKDEVFLKEGAPLYTYEQNINTLNNWSRLIA